MCIAVEKVEADLLATGWTEETHPRFCNYKAPGTSQICQVVGGVKAAFLKPKRSSLYYFDLDTHCLTGFQVGSDPSPWSPPSARSLRSKNEDQASSRKTRISFHDERGREMGWNDTAARLMAL